MPRVGERDMSEGCSGRKVREDMSVQFPIVIEYMKRLLTSSFNSLRITSIVQTRRGSHG